jgi:peptide/nickel transport system permease protein
MAKTTVAIPAESLDTQVKTAGRRFVEGLSVILRNRLATLGLVLVVLVCLTALFAPYLATHDPLQMNLADRLMTPSSGHLFGTDIYGRDMFTRIVFGTQIAMRVAFGAVLLAALIGVPLGALSGYLAG